MQLKGMSYGQLDQRLLGDWTIPPLQMTGDLTFNFALTDNIKKVANFKKRIPRF